MDDRRFTDMMFMNALVPSLASSVGLAFCNIMDSVMAGSRLGEAGLSAISVVSPIYLAFNIIDVGIGAGASIKYDRLLGEGREREAVDHFNLMLLAVLLTSAAAAAGGCFFLPEILSVLGAELGAPEVYRMCADYAGILLRFAPLFFLNIYLYFMVRSDDNPRLAGYGLLAGTVTDIALNYIFMFVMDMGIKGAAWSAVAGRVVSVCIFSAHIFARRHILRLRLPKPDLSAALRSFGTGLASSMQYAYQGLFWIAANNILMNDLGETGVAVYNVVINVSYVAMAVPDGINGVAQPLASTLTGERNFAAAGRVRGLALRRAALIGLPVLAFIFHSAGRICAVFGLSGAESAQMGTEALRLYCVGAVFGGYSSINACYFQSAEAEHRSALINLLRGIMIPLPVFGALTALAPEYIWLMFPLSEIICAAIWRTVLWMSAGTARRENRYDPRRIFSRTITGAARDVGELVSGVKEFCGRWSGDERKTYNTMAVTEEIAAVIIGNAFRNNHDEYISISLIAMEDGGFHLHVRDNANFFNPLAIRAHKIQDDSGDDLSGVEMFIIKNLAEKLFYRRYRGFNTLVIYI